MVKITVISHFYNEELLAPLFLRHYRDVDEIHILLETDTNDNTRELLSRQPNVIVKDVHSSGGNDAREMLNHYNAEISTVKDGWVYLVDADEFIFPEYFEDAQTFLERQTADVVMTYLPFVYRHISDSDIDYNKEVIPQRVHGVNGGKENLDWIIKPCVFRATCGYVLAIGNHTYVGEHSQSAERYVGAHWKLADPEIAIRRRLSNKARMSIANRKRGYCNHEYYITQERIEKTLNRRLNFPVIPLLVKQEDQWNSI